MYVAPRRDGPPLALVAARSISSLACVAAASGVAARIAARAAAATDALVSVRSRRFKRRDWNYLHKPDGSASDSDSDGSIESAGDAARSSSGASASEDGEESGSETSASDADVDVDGRDAANEGDARGARYERARDAIASALSGASDGKLRVAAKCRACPGTLLLSGGALATHAASKKHAKNLKRLGKGGDEGYVCFYPAVREDDGVVSDGDAETHAERLARLRAQKILKAEQGDGASGGKFSLDQFDDSDDDDDDDDGSNSDDSDDAMTKRAAKKTLVKEMETKKQSKTEKRSRRHAQSKRLKSAKKKKSKPGKRQRMAMKATGAE